MKRKTKKALVNFVANAIVITVFCSGLYGFVFALHWKIFGMSKLKARTYRAGETLCYLYVPGEDEVKFQAWQKQCFSDFRSKAERWEFIARFW